MSDIKRVTVIGAGIMGFGIAKAIFKHGLDVTLFDNNNEQLNKTCDDLKNGARRGMDPEKIHKADSLASSAQNADLIIEAIIEDLDIKCELFKKLGKLADPNTIFASNTSSLDIQAMADASGRQHKFLGLHFFNPAFLMRLVEVIKSEHLSNSVLETIMTFLNQIKKSGIICKPSPGFIVNRILIPVMNEAFFILNKNSTDITRIDVANDIDSAISNKQILLMGLFDLVDLTGLDTTLSVADRIFSGFGNSSRYKPAPLLLEYVQKGYLGRKTKRGIYYYGNQKNDPDYNPRLNEQNNVIAPIKDPKFDILDLLAVIANESFRLLEEKISENFKDIDFCMESGGHWPKGPFALIKEYGLKNIYKRLIKLYNSSNSSKRYEPSLLFKIPPMELKEYLST